MFGRVEEDAKCDRKRHVTITAVIVIIVVVVLVVGFKQAVGDILTAKS